MTKKEFVEIFEPSDETRRNLEIEALEDVLKCKVKVFPYSQKGENRVEVKIKLKSGGAFTIDTDKENWMKRSLGDQVAEAFQRLWEEALNQGLVKE